MMRHFVALLLERGYPGLNCVVYDHRDLRYLSTSSEGMLREICPFQEESEVKSSTTKCTCDENKYVYIVSALRFEVERSWASLIC